MGVPGYTEVKTLGSGGFGDVVLARHDASGTPVAIKYLRRELLADPEFAGMFRAEAGVLASLSDPNVVRLYEYVESPAGAAIVMELVEGVSLREILTRQGRTTPEAALVVLQGSLLGLAAAHRRGVVHRDYKPENVLINGAGASKLTDFGIAARAGDRAMAAGTLAYAPPEQFAGSPASPATDVYAATATFYECLTGSPPFTGNTAELLMHQHLAEPVPLDPVPGPLRPLVAAGLAKDPGSRPADGAALVAGLRTAAAGEYGPDWEQRGRSRLGEAALLLAALWPSGGTAAVQGATVHRVSLLRRVLHGHVGGVKAAVAAGVVVGAAAGIAVASTVIASKPAARPTPSPASASAPAPVPAAGPAQLTGTQLAAALLPVSDFPAGYRASETFNSGTFVIPDDVPLRYTVPTTNCRLGNAEAIYGQDGSFLPNFGTASATQSLAPSSQTVGVQSISLSQAVYQFASLAHAQTFFSSVRACLIDNKAWSHGVDTAPVDGDQAVTADLLYNSPSESVNSSIESLFVLHGTDVLALTAAAFPFTLGPVTIPGPTQLISELMARVDALGPGPGASGSG